MPEAVSRKRDSPSPRPSPPEERETVFHRGRGPSIGGQRKRTSLPDVDEA